MFEGWVGNDGNWAVLVDGAVVALQSNENQEIIYLTEQLFLLYLVKTLNSNLLDYAFRIIS